MKKANLDWLPVAGCQLPVTSCQVCHTSIVIVT
jgi:protein gp37